MPIIPHDCLVKRQRTVGRPAYKCRATSCKPLDFVQIRWQRRRSRLTCNLASAGSGILVVLLTDARWRRRGSYRVSALKRRPGQQPDNQEKFTSHQRLDTAWLQLHCLRDSRGPERASNGRQRPQRSIEQVAPLSSVAKYAGKDGHR